MADQSSDQNPQSPQPDPIELETIPFDPTEPSTPVAFPITTLQDLESRSYFNSFHYPFNVAKVALPPAPLPERRRILVCHDMAGGYIDDKWVQGGTNPDAYALWHWHLIDVFVYFSHNLVTLPPPCWTNAAHRHGVKVLGTFITEGSEGRAVCETLLSTKDSAQMYAERLTELAVSLGFDGWLLNMEVALDSQQIPNLEEFVIHLTQSMHSKLPGSLVIWYDSVTVNGELSWQNQLNENNKPFFDICDGIFVNYFWKEDFPRSSAAVAGERKHDVYMGIDVFGRRTYGGGQWNTNAALDLLKKEDVSAAIFAPGWVYETKQQPDFQTAQNRWWNLVKESWGIVRSYLNQLPFYSNFDQGHGYHVSINGVQISDASWNNISCQGFQPILDATDHSASDSIRSYTTFEEAFNGGGSITLEGNLEEHCFTEIRLFQGELLVGNLPLRFMFSSKLKGDSQLGLSFEFRCTANETKLAYLATNDEPHFSHNFSGVIETTKVDISGAPPYWLVQKGLIQMNGYILTNINAVCYKPPSGSSEYSAVLGDISLRSIGPQPDFPPSSSWLVKGEYVKLTLAPDETRLLDIKITWKLKDSTEMAFRNYNIHVVGADGGLSQKFLGVADVEAFYVSKLPVFSFSPGLKFIIQVCGVDGSIQKLGESPFLQVAC